MGIQDRQFKPSPSGPDDAEGGTQPAAQMFDASLIHDVADLLDEIDGVLEKNAEEFVRGYVQKGGQ
jgi:prokaryotic ubiquitin-like protein Pup